MKKFAILVSALLALVACEQRQKDGKPNNAPVTGQAITDYKRDVRDFCYSGQLWRQFSSNDYAWGSWVPDADGKPIKCEK